MRLRFGWARVGLLAALAVKASFGALVDMSGNAYGGSGIRANFLTLMPLLDYGGGTIDFFGQCNAGNSCLPSYNSGPQSINNASGKVFGGATFTGANSGAAGNALYVRQISGSRNSFYTPLNGNGGFTQWTSSLSTFDGQSGTGAITGTPSITINLAPGTRSAGFDFGQRNSLPSNVTITATTASGSVTETPTNRYDTGTGSPNYLTTGPGFYGVTSNLEDILTITIVANASSASNWVLNIANFRAGVQIHQATPEPSTQLALGSALILISLLLRYRSKSARGGTA